MTQQRSDLIERLRALRVDARRLRATLVDDLRQFQKLDDNSFFTLPTSDRKGISTATTCTALMALIDSNKLSELRPSDQKVGPNQQQVGAPTLPAQKERISPERELFSAVVAGTWESSGLRDLNAFSTCMVIRAAGFLVTAQVFTSSEVRALKHVRQPGKREKKKLLGVVEGALGKQHEPSLDDIILTVAKKAPASFSIPGYPPKSTMAYWFVDGITKAKINLPAEYWSEIANWATLEFETQLSYVVSGDDPLMDPASLAMAACLISRIRKTCAESDQLSEISKKLPSKVELMHAVQQVFEQQSDSGIWHKYFPLFHFPGSGAADYCFSFEFLEAILIEFSEFEILSKTGILEGIEKAVKWCGNNRFKVREGTEVYNGWNAGGEVRNLAAGIPEAWATGAVHMFLWELDTALSGWLDQLLLSRFGVDRADVEPTSKQWDDLIDVDLQLPGGKVASLKQVVEDQLLRNTMGGKPREAVREPMISGRRSALLFGPPGTSKTTLAEVIAQRIGWPLLVITPSSFLSLGLEKIYVRANEIFEDLMDISDAVILFDEMDALVQTIGKPGKNKEGIPGLDVTRLLLTTSMLPKLADLHKRARVVFLMATNHIQELDPAITRPGRFDLLICVGPPNWTQKIEGLSKIFKKLPAEQVSAIQSKLESLGDSNDTSKRLDSFTVADLKSFLEHLKGTDDLADALDKLSKADFEKQVREWAEKFITMNTASGLLEEFSEDSQASRIQ